MNKTTRIARAVATAATAISMTIAIAANAAPVPDSATAAAKPADEATPAKKSIFALVSAIGDQFSFVRQKESTGSNMIDNNIRRTLKVTDNGLNYYVLRGLDAAIVNAHPDSERVYITLKAADVEDVLPQKREEVAIGKVVSELEKLPQRANWDKIIVAVPKYLQSERMGMGPKLHGLGIYVQPLVGASLEGQDGNPDIDVSAQGMADTTNPEDGKKNQSKIYVAPYAYMQLYVIDPKTMRVIEKVARHDFTKLNDPTSVAIDVGRSIRPEVLAKSIGDLIERSAARAVGETELGVTVQIEEIRPAGAPAVAAPPKK